MNQESAQPNEHPCDVRKRDHAKRFSKTAGHFAIQLAFLLGVCYVGNAVSATLPISIPGNIVSMTLLLTLLISGIVDAGRIKLVSDFLLKYMPVFFIPAGVTILSCLPLIQGHIPQFILVCLITTVMVFLTTSLTVIGVTRLQKAIGARRNRRCEGALGNDDAPNPFAGDRESHASQNPADAADCKPDESDIRPIASKEMA